VSRPVDLSIVVGATAIATTAIGIVVFLGWALDIEVLRRLPPDPIVMLPSTAVGFTVGGAALWLLRHEGAHNTSVRIGRALAAIVFLLGLLFFIERVSGIETGIAQLLFADRVARYPYRPIGLMATNSTICFTLAGASLLLLDVELRQRWRPSQLLATTGLAIAMLALVGHLYGARPLYAVDRAAGMALITTLGFVSLLLGLVLARAHRGHVAVLTAPDLGGVLARRLLPATIVVPLVLGWLYIGGRVAQLFSREGGTALLVLTTIAVLLILVVRSAVVVRAVDRERQAVLEREAEARAEAEQLAEVLQDQTAELEVQSEEAHEAAARAEAATKHAQEAAAEAARARAEAEAASRAKSEFLAVMSHELRTPLNAIGGYVELMQMEVRGPITEAQRDDLTRIKRSQQHLLGLINEVLNYMRIEAGAMRYDIASFSVREAMEAVEPLIAPLVRAKGLTYERVDGHADDRVRADPERVRQIFINLVSNAVKFTPPGGRIALRCESRPDVIAFRVSDTGIGIPTDKLTSIFDPFVQINTRLTRTEEGIGLGLAISRDLARGMGGELTVESREGVGSTFTLTLPRG
jgi:signal transduction histidine kinase